MRLKRPGKYGDVVAALIIFFIGMFLLVMVHLPDPKRPFNWGFNSNWTCTPQSLDVTCQLKR
jgi:hypothetical protein